MAGGCWCRLDHLVLSGVPRTDKTRIAASLLCLSRLRSTSNVVISPDEGAQTQDQTSQGKEVIDDTDYGSKGGGEELPHVKRESSATRLRCSSCLAGATDPLSQAQFDPTIALRSQQLLESNALMGTMTEETRDMPPPPTPPPRAKPSSSPDKQVSYHSRAEAGDNGSPVIMGAS